jgi:capsular exopolysaccharide synthesis family protein
MVGLVLGILLILLVEHLDDSYKSNEEIEKDTANPVLGGLPFVDPPKRDQPSRQLGLTVSDHPKGPMAEACRSLRTALLLSTTGGAPRLLHFTSAAPGEGKSVACVSLATSFAQAGNTVLCIDCDLRNSSLHRVFDLPDDQGLTNYLVSTLSPADITQGTDIDGLYLIASGPLPPNPVELLSSDKMASLLKLAVERFDYVLIDGPPVLGLADALVLSRMSGATVFILDAGKSKRTIVRESLKRLRASQSRLIGIMLQKVGQPGGRGYGYGYGYGYRYNYQYLYAYGRDRIPGDGA